MDIQPIAEGLQFPEGPIAMADGTVILTEIKGQRLTRVHPDGRKETVVETGGGPNGAAIGPDGAIYITNNGGSFEWLDVQGMTIPPFDPVIRDGRMFGRGTCDTKAGLATMMHALASLKEAGLTPPCEVLLAAVVAIERGERGGEVGDDFHVTSPPVHSPPIPPRLRWRDSRCSGSNFPKYVRGSARGWVSCRWPAIPAR